MNVTCRHVYQKCLLIAFLDVITTCFHPLMRSHVHDVEQIVVCFVHISYFPACNSMYWKLRRRAGLVMHWLKVAVSFEAGSQQHSGEHSAQWSLCKMSTANRSIGPQRNVQCEFHVGFILMELVQKCQWSLRLTTNNDDVSPHRPHL